MPTSFLYDKNNSSINDTGRPMINLHTFQFLQQKEERKNLGIKGHGDFLGHHAIGLCLYTTNPKYY